MFIGYGVCLGVKLGQVFVAYILIVNIIGPNSCHVLQMFDESETKSVVDVALDAGYSLIDTAYLYFNERYIGDTLKRRMDEGKLKREDIFVTSKVS